MLDDRRIDLTNQPKTHDVLSFLLPLSSNEEIKPRIIRSHTYIIIISRSCCCTAV